MVQDAAQIKERILYFLQKNGPSLPVHMAQAAGMSILFTSAFLSELLSERRVKTSVMRVGNSPLYFLPGQEPQLEKFSNHLKSKEKEAYLILKEKEFLKDSEMEPAIRVALREIKDFALPFQKDDEVYWRYFTTEESKFHRGKKEEKREPENKINIVKTEERNEEPVSEISEEIAKEVKEALDIFDEPKSEERREPEKIKKEEKSKSSPKKPSQKKTTKKPARKNESARNKFFNRVKEFLANQNTEILDIEEIGTTKITFRVKNIGENEEYLAIAYNKKRVTDLDIINAHKKAEEMGIGYKILCLGEPLKKLDNLINAAKTLRGIEKIE